MPLEPRDRLILALDVDNADRALEMVELLGGHVGAFKVGLELVNSAGVGIFQRLKAAGADRVFYDAKLHDIPNTVAGAARAIAGQGIWMVNVHCAGGSRMIRAASDALDSSPLPRPILLGVTLLTSISPDELACEIQSPLPVSNYVVHMAKLAQLSGANGVVASPLEIEITREICGPSFVIVTPGIRPAGVDSGDQRRTMTPGEAIRRGADYLVIGRAVTAAENPVAAAEAMLDEIAPVSG